MNAYNISQNDWRFLALISGTPDCLVGAWEKIEFVEKDLDNMIEVPMVFEEGFEAFHNGTHIYDRSHKELLEYAQAMKIEYQELSQELLVRAGLIGEAIAAIARH